jgi:trans-aconitate 2-methyltransferase
MLKHNLLLFRSTQSLKPERMSSWNPDNYLRFGDERTRPAVDLAFRIRIEQPRRVIDLGCGPGNSTQVLRNRWPAARVCGLDSSPEMIAAARQSHPDQEWILGQIEDWSPDQPYDLVFSNAALHWIPDHRALVRRLFDQVAAGGALAFQIPSAGYSAVRSCIHEIADDAAWATRMDEARRAQTLDAPEVYYDALATQATAVDLWEAEYHHVMESATAIVEWVSSTALRPFLSALDGEEDQQRFLALVTERVTEAYPKRSYGRVLFPFKRTFVIAYA